MVGKPFRSPMAVVPAPEESASTLIQYATPDIPPWWQTAETRPSANSQSCGMEPDLISLALDRILWRYLSG